MVSPDAAHRARRDIRPLSDRRSVANTDVVAKNACRAADNRAGYRVAVSRFRDDHPGRRACCAAFQIIVKTGGKRHGRRCQQDKGSNLHLLSPPVSNLP